jgi:hypothetical protein
MVEVRRDLRQQLADMVTSGIAAGSIKSDADPAATATILMGGLRGLAFQWLLEPDDFDIDRALKELSADLDRLLSVPAARPV